MIELVRSGDGWRIVRDNGRLWLDIDGFMRMDGTSMLVNCGDVTVNGRDIGPVIDEGLRAFNQERGVA